MSLEIITTGDGTHSLRNSELNETYHSVHGARQESLHVFIRNGFDCLVERNAPDPIRILEIGFGTGLNALLTLTKSQSVKNRIMYTSLEAFPIPNDVWPQLNYPQGEEEAIAFRKIHECPWNVATDLSFNFQLLKLRTTLQQATFSHSSFDLIYFDAFAPNKQPEMWTLDMLEKISSFMADGAVFVTYCAKGQLKRDLKSLGLHVETLVGPPGKKEMVRASKRI